MTSRWRTQTVHVSYLTTPVARSCIKIPKIFPASAPTSLAGVIQIKIGDKTLRGSMNKNAQASLSLEWSRQNACVYTIAIWREMWNTLDVAWWTSKRWEAARRSSLRALIWTCSVIFHDLMARRWLSIKKCSASSSRDVCIGHLLRNWSSEKAVDLSKKILF